MSGTASQIRVAHTASANTYGVGPNERQSTPTLPTVSRKSDTSKDEVLASRVGAPPVRAATSSRIASPDGVGVTVQKTPPVAKGQALELPPVTGPIATPQAVAGVIGWFGSYDATSDAALMWLALRSLAESCAKDVDDANKIVELAHAAKLQHKNSEMAAKKSEIAHDNKAAELKFMTATIDAVVTGCCGTAGTNGMLGNSGAMPYAVGGVVKAVGAKLAADEEGAAKEEQRRQLVWSKQEEIDQSEIDSAKNNYEQARDSLKHGVKILTDHYEQQTQAVQATLRA